MLIILLKIYKYGKWKNHTCSFLSLTFHFWTFYSIGHNTPPPPPPHTHNMAKFIISPWSQLLDILYIHSGLLFCSWWLQNILLLLLVELPWFYTNLIFRIFSKTDCCVMFSELQVCPFVSRFWHYVGCFPSHYNLNLFKSKDSYISYIYSLSAPLASSLYPQRPHLVTLYIEWVLSLVLGE